METLGLFKVYIMNNDDAAIPWRLTQLAFKYQNYIVLHEE